MVKLNINSLRKTIAVFMFMITAFVFLSFNAFADTPVQPLQVINYSDTTTNVRISGTAERLHYNVESFQVVFMNPPNNYGTSCTPVLVSFRFYNSSDLPAYVGQAEFELTATTSTGAVNTIIYGYDQISTDLFVAESSYSTAEVGRIGIGASNDFAYYTGFVIPPKTSLYFSCIVYVNASAYAQNNTGATEDVNQVTLSALNLYTNQISFSDDYPYHGQPIDFSEITQAISQLGSTVSTSSEMQTIISILTYSGPHPTNSNSQYGISTKTYSKNGVNFQVTRYVGAPSIVTYDFELNGATDTLESISCLRYPIYVSIFESTNGSNFISTGDFTINNIFPSGYSVYLVQGYSNIFDINSINYGNLALYLKLKYDSWRSFIPQYQNVSFYQLYVDIPSTTSLQSFPEFTFKGINDPYPRVTDEYVAIDEYMILRDYYNAYKNVNGLDDSSDISNDVADVSDSNHIIEESYYSANASAIEATGLSNYHFSNEQNNGIGSVANDFMLLWNALGSWNGVYVFSLTMALATFIMRHRGMLSSKSKDDKGGDE